MGQWRYGGAAAIGVLVGTLVFLLLSWLGQSEELISSALLKLAGLAFTGALAACAILFLQGQATKRANERHDRVRQIRIAKGHGR